MNENTQKWFDESVKYFKELGFFQSGFEITKIHEALLEDYFDHYLEREPPPTGWGPLDWLLLAQDEERTSEVGWEIGHLNKVEEILLKSIEHWSRISRGAFAPTEVAFRWVEKDKHEHIYEITMSQGDKSSKLTSNQLSTTHALLYQINTLIEDTGIQFYECNHESFEGQVIALTEAESEKLIRERGWQCDALKEDLDTWGDF